MATFKKQNTAMADPTISTGNPPATVAPNNFFNVTRVEAVRMKAIIKDLGLDGKLYVNNVGGFGEPIPENEYTSEDEANWNLKIGNQYHSVSGLFQSLMVNKPYQFAVKLFAEVFPGEPWQVSMFKVPGLDKSISTFFQDKILKD